MTEPEQIVEMGLRVARLKLAGRDLLPIYEVKYDWPKQPEDSYVVLFERLEDFLFPQIGQGPEYAASRIMDISIRYWSYVVAHHVYAWYFVLECEDDVVLIGIEPDPVGCEYRRFAGGPAKIPSIASESHRLHVRASSPEACEAIITAIMLGI